MLWLLLPVCLALLPVLREMRQGQVLPGLQAGPAAQSASAGIAAPGHLVPGSGGQRKASAGLREFLLAWQMPGQVIRVVNAMAAGGLAAAGTAIVFAVTWFAVPALLSRGPDARHRRPAGD